MDKVTRRPISAVQQRGGLRLFEALKLFCAETGRDTMPLQYLMSFLLVMLEEGNGVTDYAQRAHVSKSVMSRHLLDIGDRTRQGAPGFGLVTCRPNLMELRRHEYFLTPKGRALAERILRLWQMSRK